MQKAKDNGFLFEQMLFDSINQYFSDFVVRREKEIKDEYGNDITAIDIEIYKNLKLKDLKKDRNIHIFIQAKWKDTSEPIKSINHFIKCCDEIKTMKKLDKNDIHCIYATKVDISTPSKEALNKLNNGENIVCDDMERCVYNVTKRIADIYNKKIPKFVNKIEFTQLLESDNYEDMKKAELISLVVNLYEYKKTNASKLKRDELIKILVNKNNLELKLEDKSEDNRKKQNNYIKTEYNEPDKRCVGEVKSKLLKKDSKLYNHIMRLKEILKKNGFDHQDRMDLHTEVLNDNTETYDDFIKRVNMLEGREFDVRNSENYDIIGRSIVFMLGDLEGYKKDLKITIAFIDNDKIKDAYKYVIDNL